MTDSTREILEAVEHFKNNSTGWDAASRQAHATVALAAAIANGIQQIATAIQSLADTARK